MRKNLIKKKKSQFQIGESIAVLFVFFLFLIFGLIFYFNLQKSSLKDRYQQAQELQAISIAQRVGTIPELRCTEDESLEVNCFDIINLDSVSRLLPTLMTDPEARAYYLDFFGETTIVIRQFDALSGNWIKTYVIYNNTPERFVTGLPIRISVVLKNTTVQNTRSSYYYGVLEITAYLGSELE